jgi:hypothetical protein
LQRQLVQLPDTLQPSLKRLLTFEVAEGASPQQQMQQLEQLQTDMQAFLAAVDAELSAAAGTGGAATDNSSGWRDIARDQSVSGTELAGLVGAVGAEGAAAVLQDRREAGRGRRRHATGYSSQDAYDQLAEVHDDQSIQAYLAVRGAVDGCFGRPPPFPTSLFGQRVVCGSLRCVC